MSQLDEKTKLVNTLESEMNALRNENKVLKRQVEAQGKSILLLSQENEELKRSAPKPQIITERVESKTDIRPYQLEIEKLQNRLQELLHENEVLINENNSIMSSSENLKSLQKELNVFKSRYEKEKLHHGETRTTLESLLKSRAEKITALQNQLVNVCGELEKRNKERAETRQLQELLVRHQSQLQELEMQRRELVARLTYLQQEQEGKNHELDRLQNQLQELKIAKEQHEALAGKLADTRRPHYAKRQYVKAPREKEVHIQTQQEVTTVTEKISEHKEIPIIESTTEEVQIPVSRK